MGGSHNKDCAYNQYNLKTTDSFDNFWMFVGDFCYDNTLCENGYQVTSSTYCFDCRNTHFSFDCKNCSNIIGCSGLRNKQYQIFNKQVTKEEYAAFVRENLNGSLANRRALLRVRATCGEACHSGQRTLNTLIMFLVILSRSRAMSASV